MIGLQTLAWQLLCRRCQEGQLHPVSFFVSRLHRSFTPQISSKMLVWPWTCIGHMLTNGKVLFQRIIGLALSLQVLFLVATSKSLDVPSLLTYTV